MDKKAPNSTNAHSNARQARKLPFTSDIYLAYIHLYPNLDLNAVTIPLKREKWRCSGAPSALS